MGLIEGKVVCKDLFGNPLVVKAETTSGVPVKAAIAVKIREHSPFAKSEADMVAYVSEQSKRHDIDASELSRRIMVPQFISCYDIYEIYGDDDDIKVVYDENGNNGRGDNKPKFVAIISEFINGVSLNEVWSAMNEKERASIKEQLRHQIELFRKCQQRYIGRIRHQPTVNFYKWARNEFMGPFDSEVNFDKWCLSRINSHRGVIFGFIKKMKWRWKLHSLRGKDSNAFVLTHGDLAARNIMVRREEVAGMVDWKIAGIVDWEASGFLPEWAEYAIAREISRHDEEWKQVLLEVLEPFKPTEERLKFQALITEI
ncbi:hypothetical protein CNMCM6106_002506 [Aspergillus hiratsukae]|uniref:Aminoglycoside phosphotransferase domain-containing protein n=1 Tax=Aspergillus hiratsukae TaxID=1194566 RepID=A0A8H6Q5P5_9EURO|nr:hypothetical protein CNMCM6106_002506 [Aspergillus hiratsukae]